VHTESECKPVGLPDLPSSILPSEFVAAQKEELFAGVLPAEERRSTAAGYFRVSQLSTLCVPSQQSLYREVPFAVHFHLWHSQIIQSDRGSNFTSRMFAEVLEQLRVKHQQSGAYHAQSQEALERFHQTLKSHLRDYWVELEKDWEEGLPWWILAAREVTQEST